MRNMESHLSRCGVGWWRAVLGGSRAKRDFRDWIRRGWGLFITRPLKFEFDIAIDNFGDRSGFLQALVSTGRDFGEGVGKHLITVWSI